MPKAYSADMRQRVIGRAEGGNSPREAADQFEINASATVKWLLRWRDMGSAAGPIFRSCVVALALVALIQFGLLPSEPDGRGTLFTHEIASPYQAGSTQIRVLLPHTIDPKRRYKVIYVLPANAQSATNGHGDGLLEVESLDLQNKHQAIFVMPTFTAAPWYCDHPSDLEIRQESYVINTVIPFVDRTYPTLNAPEGRYLLGFSKSGWGAWSLLLRHPDVFGRALAWDSPMMIDKIGRWETPDIFGTQEDFESYRLSALVRKQGPTLGKDKRLLMIGHGTFREDQRRMDELLTKLGIPHTYRGGPQRKHDWRSGWLSEAVDMLVLKPQFQHEGPRRDAGPVPRVSATFRIRGAG